MRIDDAGELNFATICQFFENRQDPKYGNQHYSSQENIDEIPLLWRVCWIDNSRLLGFIIGHQVRIIVSRPRPYSSSASACSITKT